jgi:hypothetical protein
VLAQHRQQQIAAPVEQRWPVDLMVNRASY